jgi:hypothetical protein
MATLDDLCETHDEWELSGDTPMRFKFDGQFFDIAAIHKEPNGTLTVELEEES